MACEEAGPILAAVTSSSHRWNTGRSNANTRWLQRRSRLCCGLIPLSGKVPEVLYSHLVEELDKAKLLVKKLRQQLASLPIFLSVLEPLGVPMKTLLQYTQREFFCTGEFFFVLGGGGMDWGRGT